MTEKSILESMKELADADWIYYQDSNFICEQVQAI